MNIMVLSMPFNNSANFLKLVVNRQTDGPTDRPTDMTTYRAAIAAKYKTNFKAKSNKEVFV